MTQGMSSYLTFSIVLLTDALLLLYFSQGQMFVRPRYARQWLGFLLLPAAVMAVARLLSLNFLESPYPLLISELMMYGIFLALWQGRFTLTNWYYALCYLLISNCVRTEVFLLGVKIFGFGESSPEVYITVILAGTLGIRWCLTAVRYFVQKHTWNINYAILALSLLSTVPYMFVRGLAYWLPVSNNDINGFVCAALASSCLLSLIITVGSTIQISKAEYQRQLIQMQSIMERQQSQFALKLGAIDEVNRKYHDMKNILLYLEKHGVDAEASEQIRRMMGEIKPCEMLQKTGNDAVDIILNEKLTLCTEKSISCVPYIDGTVLNFIEPVDICIIFGNAMDNAIECCERYQDSVYRRINVKVAEKNGMVILLFRNSCLDSPRLDEPFFTSKADMDNHGFGLSNIRVAAEKYGGEVSVRTEDGEFRLTIALPAPQAETA